MDFSLIRRLGAGLDAFVAGLPIINAIVPAGTFGPSGRQTLFPGF